jgi:hypothetical protein
MAAGLRAEQSMKGGGGGGARVPCPAAAACPPLRPPCRTITHAERDRGVRWLLHHPVQARQPRACHPAPPPPSAASQQAPPRASLAALPSPACNGCRSPAGPPCSCADGKEYSIDVRAGGTLLPGGRDSCPWPMFLPGSDGYSPEFDFRNKVGGAAPRGRGGGLAGVHCVELPLLLSPAWAAAVIPLDEHASRASPACAADDAIPQRRPRPVCAGRAGGVPA